MYIGNLKDVNKEKITVDGAKGVSLQWLLSQKEEVPYFYMRYVTVEPGGIIPLHSHEVIHEMYIVKGEGAVLLEKEEKHIEEGNFVYMPSDKIHGTKNTGTTNLEFICCINKA
ncbi:cupin domain-containing protein [candidate division KSB1 bacterium]